MLIDNIIASADVANQEYRIFLCKPDKTVIRELTKSAYNKIYTPQLGGADTFEFSIPKKFNGKDVKNYDDIVGRNFIKIQQLNTVIGYFEIQSTQTDNDGIKEIKNVKCYSIEVKLINKQLYLTTGTFKLVNNSDPTKGLLNIIVGKSQSWSIGNIDSSLLSKERYFDISATNILELMLNQMQTSYECVFEFDTVNNLINAYALSNFGRQSPINISLNNLIKTANVEVLSSEAVTRLYLYGDNEISVYDVNLGQPFIQNFNFYKNTRFMSQGLINALDAYDAKVASYQTQYTSYISQLNTLNAQLETYQNDLLILQNELATLQKAKSYAESIQQSLVAINAQIASKNAEISAKQSQINSVNNQIASINLSINSIITVLLMKNNFTTAQLKELDNFIIEDTYQDSSYLVTDSSTYQDKINVETALLNAGKNILARVSSPRYRVTMDIINFLKVKDFSYWWDKLYIGDIIRIDVDGFIVSVRVTGYKHDWDNNKLDIQLGDKYQLDDANIELFDLLKSSISAGTSVNFERSGYKYYVQNNKNEVLEFINGSIDVNKNAIISGTNVGIKIDGSGILATALDVNTGNVSPNQLRISNNAIVLSDDAFNTAKTAIGKLANGQYGVSAEVVAGKMFLGNNMIIETSSGDFRVDGNGVSITKMSLNMTSSNNLNKIILDPNNGFKIQTRSNVSTAFTDKFYVDTNGNLQFSGTLNGANGTFSGTLNASTFIGGSINIGNGRFIVDSGGNMSATGANISGNITGSTIFGSNMTSSNINGGTIIIGENNKVKITDSSFGGRIEFLDSNDIPIVSLASSNSSVFNNFEIRSDAQFNLRSVSGLSLSSNRELSLTGYGIRCNSRPFINNYGYVITQSDSTDYIGNHNHGIPDGTALSTVGGGYVIWVASGGHEHGLRTN